MDSKLRKVSFDHVNSVRSRDKLKIHISIFRRLVATKLGTMVTLAGRFRTQTRMSLPTTCLVFLEPLKLLILAFSLNRTASFGSILSIFEGAI